jgi:hypothetical protein
MRKTQWLAPLLWGLYPAAALLAANVQEIQPAAALRALLVAALAGLALYGLLRALRVPPARAAAAAAFGLALFFTYGHAYNALKEAGLPDLARHRLLAPVWAAALAAGLLFLLRRARDPAAVAQALSVVALVGLAFSTYQILAYQITANRDAGAAAAAGGGGLTRPQDPPDIYYLIFDAYARDDSLKHSYGVDISEFIAALQAEGFTVARCASSNYAQTRMSLASSLNMDYLEAFLPPEDIAGNDQTVLQAYVKNNRVRRSLEALGYRTVAFETGFAWTEWRDADLYLAPAARNSGLNNFETLLVETSALRLLTDAQDLPAFLVPDTRYKEEIHRERVLFVLDQLEQLPQSPGPRFVFGHIVSPHPPYVFNADGSVAPPDPDPAAAYAEQVRYINARILALVRALIARSAVPPVIILQGDHGAILADKQERMQIFNAYYLPGAPEGLLYEDISPVNTFRAVFNAFFGAQFPLLPDESYFSTYAAPYTYEQILDRRAGCAP